MLAENILFHKLCHGKYKAPAFDVFVVKHVLDKETQLFDLEVISSLSEEIIKPLFAPIQERITDCITNDCFAPNDFEMEFNTLCGSILKNQYAQYFFYQESRIYRQSLSQQEVCKQLTKWGYLAPKKIIDVALPGTVFSSSLQPFGFEVGVKEFMGHKLFQPTLFQENCRPITKKEFEQNLFPQAAKEYVNVYEKQMNYYRFDSEDISGMYIAEVNNCPVMFFRVLSEE